MSDRQRALPSWMKKTEHQVKENEPLKSKRKRKVARAAFYCMNEQELVEAAVSCLSDGACENVAPLVERQVEDKAGDTTVKIGETPAFSKTKTGCSDAEETICVSETDMDISELETVPYTETQHHLEPEGQRSGPAQDHIGLMKVKLQSEKREECSQMPVDAAEDDALQLVREIFFN